MSVGANATLLALQGSAGNAAVSHWVQTKLVVGGVGDVHEREADRVAAAMGGGAGAHAAHNAPDESGRPTPAPPDVEHGIARARGGGQPLDGEVRTQMESALGADFGDVRVHTGSSATALNHQLSARAFTTGRDIFIRNGEPAPSSAAGRQLLAHELTHVVQQRAGLASSGTLQPKRVQVKKGSSSSSSWTYLESDEDYDYYDDGETEPGETEPGEPNPAEAPPPTSPRQSARRLLRVLGKDRHSEVTENLGHKSSSHPGVAFEQGGGFIATRRETRRSTPDEDAARYKQRKSGWDERAGKKRGPEPILEEGREMTEHQGDIEFHPPGGIHSAYDSSLEEGSYYRVKNQHPDKTEDRYSRHGAFNADQDYKGNPLPPHNKMTPGAAPLRPPSRSQSPEPSEGDAEGIVRWFYDDREHVSDLLAQRGPDKLTYEQIAALRQQTQGQEAVDEPDIAPLPEKEKERERDEEYD